jgi:hypothetical protein
MKPKQLKAALQARGVDTAGLREASELRAALLTAAAAASAATAPRDRDTRICQLMAAVTHNDLPTSRMMLQGEGGEAGRHVVESACEQSRIVCLEIAPNPLILEGSVIGGFPLVFLGE